MKKGILFKEKSSMKFDERGFTLIELLVALVVTSIFMAGVFATYRHQTQTQTTQTAVLDMQQNIRYAMHIMERELRMAGFDPTRNAEARVLLADSGELQFEIDLNEDGNPAPTAVTDPDERIRYALTNDADLDGVADGTPCHLGREVYDGGLQPIAINVDALNFVYLDGNTPPNVLPTPVVDPDNIRSIQISVVARSGEQIPVAFIKYMNRRTYTNQQNDIILPAPNDTFRRLQLTSEILCRNLAFN
jgi:type IV pilus assembly protein PilW